MSYPLDEPVRLSIVSQVALLPMVRAMVAKACELAGMVADEAGKVVLSVDEALANIIRHAYHDASYGRIDMEMQTTGEPRRVVIRLRDYGQHVDASQIRSRDLEDIRPGGLGVHIIRNCMDQVEYSPAPGGGTVLTLVKTIAASAEASAAAKR